jgi:PAS domain S-box/diguanylate cyclase (GGDEF) domain
MEEQSIPPQRSRAGLGPAELGWLALVLVVGVLLSLLASRQLALSQEQVQRAHFGAVTDRATRAMVRGMDQYALLLRAAAGFDLALDGRMDERRWLAFVEPLDLSRRPARIQAIAYVDALSGPTRSAIRFIAPLTAVNRGALGFDMYRDPVRREAMERARDTGRPALSGSVHLVTESGRNQQPGVLLYFPLYRPGAVVGSVAERRAALQGWITEAFRTGDLAASILDGRAQDLGVALVDVESGHTLYRSDMPVGSSGALTRRMGFEIGGRRWRLDYRSPPGFAGGGISPLWPLLSGLISTALLLALLFTLFRGRARVRALAERNRADYCQAAQELQTMVDAVSDYAIYRIDAQGRIVTWNRGAEQVKGYAADEILGESIERFYPPDQVAAGRPREALEAAARDGSFREQSWRIRKDGSRFWADISVSAIRNAGGDLVGYAKITRDLSERHRFEEHIQFLATHDHLTQLPNRLWLDRRLKEMRAAGQAIDLLMLDLDHFKNINDVHGHAVGDQVLLEIARRLRAGLREEDAVVRFGGDEFVILLPGALGAEALNRVAEKLQTRIARPIQVGNLELSTSTSVGISRSLPDGDGQLLLREADAALFRAKALGRNRTVFFSEAIEQAARERATLERQLRDALAGDELYLVYQPQVRLDTGKLVGVEALLRWRHPHLGEISPARFVPIAEDTGLIRPIGDWVLQRALHEMGRLQRRAETPLRLAVNLSPVQLGDPGFPARLQGLLQEVDYDPALLELEITETALLTDDRQIRQALERLRALGCTLALDDFGTGYSSLSQVTHHAVSTLKIDREFVRPLPEEKSALAVAEAICGMSSALGLRVVAEGIEHPAQLRCLRYDRLPGGAGFPVRAGRGHRPDRSPAGPSGRRRTAGRRRRNRQARPSRRGHSRTRLEPRYPPAGRREATVGRSAGVVRTLHLTSAACSRRVRSMDGFAIMLHLPIEHVA